MLMMEGGLPMFIVSPEMTAMYIKKYTHKVNVKISFLVSNTSRECDRIVGMRIAHEIEQYGFLEAPRNSFKQAFYDTDETPAYVTNFWFKLAGGRIM